MAKKSLIAREKKRQLLFQRYKPRRIELKKEIKTTTSFDKKCKLNLELQKLPLNSSPSRLHNRCFITGRPKGYYRFFGLSRHYLRQMAHDGLLPGVTKASW